MTHVRTTLLAGGALAFALVLPERPGLAAGENRVPGPAIASCSAALEKGAAALAEGRMDEASAQFSAVLMDEKAPAFVRSLARFGLARQAGEEDHPAAAATHLRKLADDQTLPRFHRQLAERLLASLEPPQKEPAAPGSGLGRVALPSWPEATTIFHVVPGGSPDGNGSEARPFGSLNQARDAVRAWKRVGGGQLPKGGVKVVIHGGDYTVGSTFALSAADSGNSEAKVIYMAQPGEHPIFKGGIRITGWRKLSDPILRGRLQPEVQNQVLEADLRALGLEKWGDATDLRQRPELFCRGVPQTLARWPNQGFVKTGEVLGKEGAAGGSGAKGFHYVEDRPSAWTNESDIRLYGYWYWDWYEEYQKAASLDPIAKTISLARPYSGYGYRKNQRYCALNLFCEIDQPGEWYLDRRKGMIYWLPPAEIDPNRELVTLSLFGQPFIEAHNLEHVVFAGLTLEEGRNDAIHLRGGSDCLIAGCTIRRFGGDGIVIEGGVRHGVFGALIHTMGCGGMAVNGGSRTALTRGEHFVENCTVTNISRLKRTYAPAVLLDGCGNRIAHNHFEGMPSSAMRIEGNDHLVEFNRICRVVQESDDQGGLDMFGNPLYRGFVIRWNHWVDIGGGTHCGAAGVRLDDMISGVALYGNVFERCGAVIFGGLQIHGGKENLVDNNLFLDCFAGISFSRWGDKRWREATQRFVAQAKDPAFSTRYPELARLQQNADVNDVSRNLFVNCPSVFLRGGDAACCALNLSITNRMEPAALSDKKAIRQDPQLRRLLFDPIPFGEIGPYPHALRASGSD